MTTSIQRPDALNSFATQYPLGDTQKPATSNLSGLLQGLQQLFSMMGFGANPQDASAPGQSLASGLPGGAAGHGHGHAFGRADHTPSPAHIKGAENWDAYRNGQDLVVTNEGKDGKGGRSANVPGYFDHPQQSVFVNDQKQDFSGLQEGETFKHPKNVADVSMSDDANKGDINKIADERRDAARKGLDENKKQLGDVEEKLKTEQNPDLKRDLEQSADGLKKNIAIQEKQAEPDKSDLDISNRRLDTARKSLDENKKQLAELEEKLKGEQNPDAKNDLTQAIEGTKKNVDFTQEQLKAAEDRKNLEELKTRQQSK